MDTILAEQGLRLTYLRDPSQSDAFDPCAILDDVCDDGVAGAMLPWQNGLRIAASDHLVIATGSNDGRCFGVVAASDMATDREPFLFLDAAYLAPMARTSHLLQRMLAFAMLRVAGNAAVPVIIAACVQTPSFARSLREFGERFTAASLFPAAPDAAVIDLGMASLARRIMRVVRPASRHFATKGMFCSTGGTGYARSTIGRTDATPRPEETLIVLDLSLADDATILEEARKLYRVRPRNGTRRDLADPVGDDALQSRRRLPGATAF